MRTNNHTRDTSEDSEKAPTRRESRDRIKTLTSGTFGALVLNGKGRMAVEFMSYGCSHCQAIEPLLQQIAEKVKSNENIFRVNVAVEPGLAGNYGIQGTPTIVMFLDGAEVGRDEGPHPTLLSLMKVVTQPFES
jgi:thioredoxin 1